jgi:hypothetical protein
MGRISLFIIVFGVLCALCIFLIVNCEMFAEIPMKGDVVGISTTAAEWDHQLKITAEEDAVANGYFGRSVSVSENYVIVGANNDESGAGAAYIFAIGDWSDPEKITPDVPIANARFGGSVDIDGNYAIVGAYNANRAYVFHFNGTNWDQVAEFTGAGMFGCSVSIKGNHAIVGAYDDNGNKGEAYIYYKDHPAADGWGNVALLTDAGGAAGDLFGYSVCISDNYAIVGAPNADGTEGLALIYTKITDTNWGPGVPTEIKKGTPIAGDAFGRSVAVTDSYAAAGASGKQYAYAFRRSGSSWIQEAELIANPASQAGDNFGWSIALSGTQVIVGAYGDDSNRGSAFGFIRSKDGTWGYTYNNPLAAETRAADENFGYSVAVCGRYAVVGAYKDSTVFANGGSAHIFRLK